MRQFLELVTYKAFADLRAERQRTYLGFIWWFLEPLLFMLVLAAVFGGLLGRGRAGFVQNLLVGLVTWQWFKSIIGHSASSILQSSSLLQNVRLNPVVFPLSVALADTVKFSLVLVVLLVVLFALGYPPNAAWAFMPLVLVSLFLFSIGISFLVASIVPFVPDLRVVIEPVLQAMFFLSPIIYTLDALSPEIQAWVSLNPMSSFIESMRSILLHGEAPDLPMIGLWFAVGIMIAAVGIAVLTRLAREYPKLPA